MVALQDLLDPAIEPLDHAAGLRMLRQGQPVFDAERLIRNWLSKFSRL